MWVKQRQSYFTSPNPVLPRARAESKSGEDPFLPLSLSVLSAEDLSVGETSTQIIVHTADI